MILIPMMLLCFGLCFWLGRVGEGLVGSLATWAAAAAGSARRSTSPQAAKASSLTGSSVGLGLAAVSVGLALARRGAHAQALWAGLNSFWAIHSASE